MEGEVLTRESVVYTPACPDPREGRQGVLFEIRRSGEGEPVGVAFTSQDRLVEALGESQPWVALPLDRLQGICGAAGFSTIVVDPLTEESARWWTPEAVEAFSEVMEARHG